jgi:hypothetical protein
VILVLLLAAELCAGVRLTRGIGIAVAAVLGVSLVANVDTMRVAGGYFRAEASYNRSELAALELVRGQVSPDFVVEEGSTALLPHGDMIISAGDYFDATDEFGSPAYSLSELADAGPQQRDAADQELGRALALSAQPAPVRPQPAPVTIAAAKTFQMIASRRGRCTALRPAIGLRGRAVLPLPPGGLYYRAPRDAQVTVSLGRFGDGFALKLPSVLGSGQVRIPGDDSARPWRALVSSAAPLTVCPV